MILPRNINACPVCESALNVTELTCSQCQTRLQGRFDRPPLARIAPEHQAFIEVFVRCRGIIRDVERTLGISYPTVRARLDTAVAALEVAMSLPVAEAPSAPSQPSAPADQSREWRRRAILHQVQEGNMEASEAAELLRHL